MNFTRPTERRRSSTTIRTARVHREISGPLLEENIITWLPMQAVAVAAVVIGVAVVWFSEPLTMHVVGVARQSWIHPRSPRWAIRLLAVGVGIGFVLWGLSQLL